MQQTSRRPPARAESGALGDSRPGRPPTRHPVHLTPGARKALLGALCVALGAVAAFASMPFLFRVLPHDLHRTGTILAALSNGSEPRMVIFGSSVEMSAVDTRLLSRELHRLGGGAGDPELVYNLSSEAQEPGEAALLYQELPASVETVVQFIRPTSLAARQHVWEGKFNGMYLYGYRPEERTVAGLERVYGPPARAMLERSAWWHHFQARWVPRAALDVAMHRRVRSDLEFDRVDRDLYFPSFVRDALPESMMAAAFARNFAPEPGKRVAASGETRALLDELCALAAVTNPRRRVIFVLGPAHPHLRELYGEQYFRDLRAVTATRPCAGDAPFVHGAEAAPAEHFADELHLVPAGAEAFTRWLAPHLAQAR